MNNNDTICTIATSQYDTNMVNGQFLKQVKTLQEKAEAFLKTKYIEVGDLSIYPKEVEVYFYNNSFMDDSVHRNELQKDNYFHFYVHRFGKSASHKYKGRAGIDLCLSHDTSTYYTYLLRSVEINTPSNFICGPYKVLKAIKELGGFDSYADMEKTVCRIKEHTPSKRYDVLFSERINLGVTVSEQFRNAPLRAVVCDEEFRRRKFLHKERMVVEFLQNRHYTKEEVILFAQRNLGYIPKALKLL